MAKAVVKKNATDLVNNLFSADNSSIDEQEESIAPAFMNVNYTTPVMPELAPEEEIKVKEAVDATKKILQESEWKAFEKNRQLPG